MSNYSNGTYSVTVAENGAILVKPGDWLSKYSAAIYNNLTTLEVFVRPGPRGPSDDVTQVIANKNLINAGETILHKPTWEQWKKKRPGNGQPGTNPQPGDPDRQAPVYNRDAAVAYARRWARGRNREYERGDGDATNYISQALLAGNWPMASRVDSGKDKQDPRVWWYGRQREFHVDGSNSWFMLGFFHSFLKHSRRGICLNKGESPAAPLRPGDLVFPKYDDHISYSPMMVTRAGSRADDFEVCYHGWLVVIGGFPLGNGQDVPFETVVRKLNRLGSHQFEFWRLADSIPRMTGYGPVEGW